MKTILRYLGVSVPAFLALCLQLGAAPVYVAPNGTGNGSSWANATNSIQGAVNAAADSETVWLSNGTYIVTSTISVGKNLAIKGIDTGDKPVVDGNNAATCFDFGSGYNVALSNIVVAHGRGGSGAGVRIHGGATVQNCTIISNTATEGAIKGGGMYIEGDAPALIANCTISYNTAYMGGGICSVKTNLVIQGCLFQYNTANFPWDSNPIGGGAVSLEKAGNLIRDCSILNNTSKWCAAGGYLYESTIDNCTIASNTSVEGGGGIVAIGTNALIENCRLYENSNTDDGGGAGAYLSSSATIKNCAVTNNHATTYDAGGAVLYSGSKAVNCLIAYNTAVRRGGGLSVVGNSSVINCTVVGNTSQGYAGGMFMLQAGGGTGLVENTICYFNQPNNYTHWQASGFFYHYTCTTPAFTDGSTAFAVGDIFVDPQLVNKDAGDLRLQKGSPCINTGANQAWMTGALDMGGHHRLDKFGGIVDMGCYEYVFPGVIVSVR